MFIRHLTTRISDGSPGQNQVAKMNDKLPATPAEAEAGEPLAASGLLGCRATGEACNDPSGTTFRIIDNTRTKLGEMDDYPGAMATLINALKAKGVRSEEIRFKHDDIVHLDHYVVILRGDALKLVDRLNETEPSGLPRQQSRQRHLRIVKLLSSMRRFAHILLQCCGYLCHSIWKIGYKRNVPNDPSSATRPTGRVDCNPSAMAGFAAAHG